MVMQVSSTQINLAWSDNSGDEAGFMIEWSPDGTTFQQVAMRGANVTTYESTNLAPNRWHYYRVRAYNAAGDSASSNTVRARTLK